ncbi:ABC transporter permease [Saccharothrix texasensis]|uniref:Uncharacterized protein n=1 Tax=Saccharothrix texasensis TaxID=103734 RepID=A0A3N1H9A6_9PSEU|nr:ABC transporter permease [Saccharothrix texasensis]ROP39107.1 hypothetical protein EDD40_4481 [Saccharothrix texasensis]
MTSAYPTPVDALTERVRSLALELGAMPSRNQVMKACKVGAPKANAALDALKATGFTPDTADTTPASVHPAQTRHLHAVDNRATDEPADAPTVQTDTGTDQAAPVAEPSAEVTPVADPEPSPDPVPVDTTAPTPDAPAESGRRQGKRSRPWALLLIAAGAFVAIWGGWVGLGKLTGFGEIALLPGIADDFTIDSAITLPIGVEAYAAYALRVWLSGATRSAQARRFAKWSTIGALALGAAGQVAYHLMTAAGMTAAPWWITTFVSCLPVVVLGCAAALTHLLHADSEEAQR